MEIVATFPIQLYISIYSTLRFDFSKAYAMFWTDCSSILFEVIDTHSLNSCTVLELMGMSAFLFFFYFVFIFFLPVEQSLMCNCGQAWPMVTVYHSSLMIFGWNAHFCHLSSSPLFFFFASLPNNIFIFSYTTIWQWKSAICKSQTWSSLHILFYNTVCLSWHAENDTVNMTYSSLRYVLG